MPFPIEAVPGPVTSLEPVIPVSTNNWPSARKSGSRVAIFLCQTRKNEAATSGVRGGVIMTEQANNTAQTVI